MVLFLPMDGRIAVRATAASVIALRRRELSFYNTALVEQVLLQVLDLALLQALNPAVLQVVLQVLDLVAGQAPLRVALTVLLDIVVV
jgi:hypothetical protein